jgi:hypothetical protein
MTDNILFTDVTHHPEGLSTPRLELQKPSGRFA